MTTNPGLKKLKSAIKVCIGGFTVCAGFNIYKGDEKFYENILVPLVQRIDPERAHNLAVLASKYKIIPGSSYNDPCTLNTKVWQLSFKNPVGMAAGFDKQGETVENLHDIGFGFVEVGSVTPKPQPGNPKPRVIRLIEDSAVINRYGFNSDGHNVVYSRIKKLKAAVGDKCIVGVNLGKNKDTDDPVQDYYEGIQRFGPVADYLVINISSPNTPGLRDWQESSQLRVLLSNLVTARNNLPGKKPPLLVKLAPDLSFDQRKSVAQVLLHKECKVDGLVICNTTIERSPNLKSEYASEPGGLSGGPLKDVATEMIADMYKLTKGSIPIIGVGGIFSGKDAYEKIKAGASLIQVYTAYSYHGPPIVVRIKKELDELLRSDGLNSVQDAVGKSMKL